MKKTPNAFVSVSFTSISLRERFKRVNRVEKKEISFESPCELHLPIYMNPIAEESDFVNETHVFWEGVPSTPLCDKHVEDSAPWN